MSQLLASVTSFIITVISTLGYPGVALLMAVQTVAIPIPSEVILPFAGFLVFSGRFNLLLLAITGGVGSCMGASLAYWIGYRGGRPLVERYGKYILISHHDLNLTEKFFNRFEFWAIFIGQLLPVVRSFISFFGGIAEVNFKKFLAYTFAGSFLWSLLLGYVGMKLGQHWSSLHSKFQRFDELIVAVIVIGACWWVWRHLKHAKALGHWLRETFLLNCVHALCHLLIPKIWNLLL